MARCWTKRSGYDFSLTVLPLHQIATIGMGNVDCNMSYLGLLYPRDTGLDMHKLWSTACARQ